MALIGKILKKYWQTLLLVFPAAVLIYFLSKRISIQEVVLLVEKVGVWGPILITLLISSSFIFAPLSSTPFVVAGYILFGKDIQLYNYLALVLSVVVDFWIAKIWGRRIAIKMVGEENMEKVDRLVGNAGLKSLIFLRVFQFQMHDLISYAAGLTELSFWPYFWVSILAPVPWTALWYFVIHNQIGSWAEFLVYFNLFYIPFWIISVMLVIWWKKKASLLNP